MNNERFVKEELTNEEEERNAMQWRGRRSHEEDEILQERNESVNNALCFK